MKTKIVVLTMVLLIIFGGIFEYNFINNEEVNNSNTNIVTSIEKFDLKVTKKKTKKVAKKKTSVKKTTKKKTTKKKTTKKKTIKKKTKKKTTKRTSNKQISELQAYARDLVINKYGWSESDFNDLVQLWYRESGWNVYASSNGCYGIPQAKPGNKMKSEGSDWKTNGQTQIRWGLKYIAGRYGTPSKAWKHFKKKHWY